MKLINPFCLLALAAITILVTACQTSPRKSFETIKIGADKSTVVETLGGPTTTRRVQGQDRWIYVFRDGGPETHLTREVHFENGYAVYAGPPLKPKISAIEQDRIHAENEAADRASQQILAHARETQVGGHRGSGAGPDDALTRKLRESLYGIEPSESDERRRQPPVFEPIR